MVARVRDGDDVTGTELSAPAQCESVPRSEGRKHAPTLDDDPPWSAAPVEVDRPPRRGDDEAESGYDRRSHSRR